MSEWRKSSYTGSGENCVEVGRGIGVRDSKDPAHHVPVEPAAWQAFLRYVRASPPGMASC